MSLTSAALPLRVALLGFGDFERSALMSYLRLSGSRVPAYEEAASLADADFAIADVDHTGTLDAVLGADRVADTVFVGALAPEGALAWMMRPIDPLQVFREIDSAVALRKSRAKPRDAGAAAPPPVAAPEVVTISAASVEPSPVDQAQGGNARSAPRRAGDTKAPTAALLVDDSEIALRFLERQLQAMGLRTDTAADSQRAIEMVLRGQYDIVFLDVDLGPHSEVDGLTLCQRIKRLRPRPPATSAPLVVMVSAHTSTTDRVRGSFAGCDVYMAKPLDDETLRRSLRALGMRLPASPDSGHTSSRPGALNTLPLPQDPSRRT